MGRTISALAVPAAAACPAGHDAARVPRRRNPRRYFVPGSPAVADAAETAYSVHLPRSAAAGLDQDEEWCEVRSSDGVRRIRFHDYDEVFSVPGLYERLFYEELRCRSPRVVRALLEIELCRRDMDPDDLTILDVGAGNGMVAEELARMGADALVGVDIIEEAAVAAERDRPGLYDDYLVVDLTDVPPAADEQLASTPFNCLTSVAALGFGDIPPAAFANAYNYVEDGGLVAFTIKEDFLADGEDTGFAGLVGRMMREGALETLADERYPHRLSAAGEWLHYRAIVAGKRHDVPESWI
jgi:SAM-dependent methyltransferase